MARTPDYGTNKVRLTLRLTPYSQDMYERYGNSLGMAFGKVIEEIFRNPDVARGFADFVEKEKNISENP